jgi:hypothetical protein
MVPIPSENVTVPVGVPVPILDEIVTVKVTLCPNTLELGECAIVSEVAVCVCAAPNDSSNVAQPRRSRAEAFDPRAMRAIRLR